MKNSNLIVVDLHSVSGPITNSSSEVFVGSKDLTKKAVISILEQLAKNEESNSDLLGGRFKASKLWTEYLEEPEICEYTFPHFGPDFKEIHEAMKTVGIFNDEYHYEEDPQEVKRYENDNPMPEYPEKDEWKNKKIMAVYSKKVDEVRKGEQKIWEKIYKSQWDIEKKAWEKIFNYVLKINGLNPEDYVINFHTCRHELNFSYTLKGETEYKETPFSRAFNYWLDWGINLQKGSIIIETQSDNSCPYDFFETINRAIGGTNYHIG
jgi:hypothetical protein